MTAGQPEVVGQQQGREEIDVLARVVSSANTGAINGDDGFVESYNVMPGPIHAAIPLLARHGVVVDQDGLVHRAPSPTPPARDSGRDEAREAVARWLSKSLSGDSAWLDASEDYRGRFRSHAEQVLALPELDKLLRRPA